MTELDLWRTLVDWLDQGTPLALVTVVKVDGSAPRHCGARMLVRADGNLVGTVGGGALEQAAEDQARQAMEAGEPRLVAYKLKPDLGMSCGGSAEIYIEPMMPPERLYLFGGGHIGLAVYRLATELGFLTTVIDERPEFASHGRFPKASLVQSFDPSQWRDLLFGDRSYCVVATPGHATDRQVVRALLALKPSPRYIGMIASETKRRNVERQLIDDGLPQEQISRLRSPIGLDIGAETPGEIAVSIVAELVQVRRQGLTPDSQTEEIPQ